MASYFTYAMDDGDMPAHYGPPSWFNSRLRPCNCPERPKLIFHHAAGSDSAYRRFRCPACGQEHCDTVEG